MDGQSNATLIRKLRKKLRQIENLARCDRDLSKEEQEKVRMIFRDFFLLSLFLEFDRNFYQAKIQRCMGSTTHSINVRSAHS